MTSSTGCSGFTLLGSPPNRAMPSRIAARSTTHGTPVKSCSSTRAGANEISFWVVLFTSQRASASMSAFFTKRPSSWRSRFSRRILRENGRRATSGKPFFSRLPRLKYCTLRPPTCRAVRVPKLSTVAIDDLSKTLIVPQRFRRRAYALRQDGRRTTRHGRDQAAGRERTELRLGNGKSRRIPRVRRGRPRQRAWGRHYEPADRRGTQGTGELTAARHQEG